MGKIMYSHFIEELSYIIYKEINNIIESGYTPTKIILTPVANKLLTDYYFQFENPRKKYEFLESEMKRVYGIDVEIGYTNNYNYYCIVYNRRVDGKKENR